ncbi:DNA replication protein DnaD [Cytobacillus sp. Hz8]|uniref:DNA replication protein DnaD n=1 Tax=Cytobacillus sp. Hz8 TaxID=3347168 RepID=UPI0035D9BB25
MEESDCFGRDDPRGQVFYLYLLTNPQTTQIGIYRITKKQMAFDLGYSIESVASLMERFTWQHKLIRYNLQTRELAIKNWGKDNLHKGGKPVMDCILSELKEVEDHSLIQYVSESIDKSDICSLYESFCKQNEMQGKKDKDRDESDTDLTESDKVDDSLSHRYPIGRQKEKQKENENEKQQKTFYPDIENLLHKNQSQEDEKEIIEFWDTNGFGLTNIYAKQQLLAWLEDSRLLQPKAVILKAMNIACANNKRRLNILSNPNSGLERRLGSAPTQRLFHTGINYKGTPT